MSNELWDQLCTIDALRRGWHLTRTDTNQDFITEPFAREAFAYFLDENLNEILRILKLGDYQPTPLTRVSIPKGALGTRPGTLLAIEDRIVLFAALRLIAPPIDSTLVDGVYSYRVKKGKRDTLFNEGDVLSMPFLKTSTVHKYIDPFDPWYGLWPQFDEVSKDAFREKDYQFMATSDIAAYFENIQLAILQDQLLGLLPQEQKIINLFMKAFAAWTYDTEHGRQYLRGIPQGTQISSFFGNIYLKAIDDAFTEFGEKHDISYFRYMDDIRIFCKSYSAAREALLLLDAKIRQLHLNLQSAKTRIFQERFGEISAALLDRRLNQIENIRERVDTERKLAKDEGRPPAFEAMIPLMRQVLEERPARNGPEQKIQRARTPLKGLTDRVFRRLVSVDLDIEAGELLDRLMSEVRRNADYRLGLKLVQYARRFPREARIQSRMMELIQSELNVFPFQESQILNAIRYQSRIQDATRRYCLARAGDAGTDPQIRMEALRLIARCGLDGETIELAERVFRDADRTAVKRAATLVLVRQRGRANVDFIRRIVFHPHNGLRKLGKLYRVVKNDEGIAARIRDQAFKEGFLMVDYLPLLYLMIESQKSNIVEALMRKIRETRVHSKHSHMDMRERAQELLRFGEQNLMDRAG